MKPANRIFAKQAQILDEERVGQNRGKIHRQNFSNPISLISAKAVGQGQMELQLLHHVGIAPCVKKLKLPGRQAFGPTLCALLRRQRRAQGIGCTHDLCGEGVERRQVALGCQRQKPVQVCNPQPVTAGGGKLLRQGLDGCRHIFRHHPRRRTERGADGAVKPVFARVAGQVGQRGGQTGKASLGRGLTGQVVPAQDSSRGLGERAGARGIIYGKTFHPSYRIGERRHTGVTRRCHLTPLLYGSQDRT